MNNKFSYHPLGFIEAKAWLESIGKFDEVSKSLYPDEESTNGFKLVREANKIWNEKSSEEVEKY